MIEPKLILVGAGPGDPELISVKGLKALQAADVVMYDALVSVELLQHAPNAVKVFCGKRAGTHYMKQEEINRQIVEHAQRYGTVVRLKGGDPFIFGRGQEELEYAEKHGVPTAIIPGISSATALATSRKIPLTKRGITESVWVTTGTTSCGALSDDIELAAQSSATVVILMGIGKLPEIVKVFLKYKPATYPMAIIQNGTLPDEKVVCGHLVTIQDKVDKENITAPAIIIVGEVVDCSLIALLK
ncbi:MAG TPA: uroporphyrinogen-III C-methyltransferase [Chitinophagales bacterium]|nr:uroporphyrinogen-III C-methyltransferase [Chitinophagales bacterium]